MKIDLKSKQMSTILPSFSDAFACKSSEMFQLITPVLLQIFYNSLYIFIQQGKLKFKKENLCPKCILNVYYFVMLFNVIHTNQKHI